MQCAAFCMNVSTLPAPVKVSDDPGSGGPNSCWRPSLALAPAGPNSSAHAVPAEVHQLLARSAETQTRKDTCHPGQDDLHAVGRTTRGRLPCHDGQPCTLRHNHHSELTLVRCRQGSLTFTVRSSFLMCLAGGGGGPLPASCPKRRLGQRPNSEDGFALTLPRALAALRIEASSAALHGWSRVCLDSGQGPSIRSCRTLHIAC
jgi:hypothetical protein